MKKETVYDLQAIHEKAEKVRKAIATAGTDTIRSQLDYYSMLTVNHADKLEKVWSINTNVLMNATCQARRNLSGAICQKCYACSYLEFRKGLDDKTARNHIILTRDIIPVEYIPVINAELFRFESFADLNNEIQAINYLNICLKPGNEKVMFAIWTKNPGILYNAIMNHFNGKKPENLQIVYSSLYMNKIDDIFGKYMLSGNVDMIDKIFTVFSADYAIKNNIPIHCCEKKCYSCRICYKSNNAKYVNEIVKNEQPKYKKLLREKKMLSRVKKYFSGMIHNNESMRPETGSKCFKATFKNNSFAINSFTEYELINILVHSGKYDSYVIKNTMTGKISSTKNIAVFH